VDERRMSRKPTERKPAALSIEAKRMAIPRLEARVRELEQLDVDSISNIDDHRVQELSARIHSTLSHIYGEDSLEFARLSDAAQLNLNFAILNLAGMDYSDGPSVIDIRKGIDRGRTRAISLLRGELESLREGLAQSPSESPASGTRAPSKPAVHSTDVFIVHGHNGPAKVEVARLIERAGLNAIILHEQPNAGRTIIEKFEAHGGPPRWFVRKSRSTALGQTYGFPFVRGGTGRFNRPRFTSISGGIGFSRDFNFGKLGCGRAFRFALGLSRSSRVARSNNDMRDIHDSVFGLSGST
jgi:Predicted nucleotide-binding protein containing TIR-like domain